MGWKDNLEKPNYGDTRWDLPLNRNFGSLGTALDKLMNTEYELYGSFAGSLNVDNQGSIADNLAVGGRFLGSVGTMDDILVTAQGSFGSITVDSFGSFGGDVAIGGTVKSVVGNIGRFDSDVSPDVDNIFTLGAPTKKWGNAYFTYGTIGTVYSNRAVLDIGTVEKAKIGTLGFVIHSTNLDENAGNAGKMYYTEEIVNGTGTSALRILMKVDDVSGSVTLYTIKQFTWIPAV